MDRAWIGSSVSGVRNDLHQLALLVKILPASFDDANAIVAIWNPIIRDTSVTFNSVEKTPSEIVEMIKDRRAAGYEFLIARQGESLLGFATYAQFRGGVGYAYTMEHTVILADTARGKGVGRALIGALESHASTSGIHSLIASISDDNAAAIAFHKALGYDQVAHIPEAGRKFGRWLGLVFMQKIL